MSSYSLLEPLRRRMNALALIDVSRLAFSLVGLRCDRCGLVFRSMEQLLIDWQWHQAHDEAELMRRYADRGWAIPPSLVRYPWDTPEHRASLQMARYGHLQPWVSRWLI